MEHGAWLLCLSIMIVAVRAPGVPLALCHDENKLLTQEARLSASKCLYDPDNKAETSAATWQWCSITQHDTASSTQPEAFCCSNTCPAAYILGKCTRPCTYECVVSNKQPGFAGSGNNLPPADNGDQNDGSGGLSGAAILGIVLGTSAFVCFLMFVVGPRARGSHARREAKHRDFVARQRKHAPSVGALFRREVNRSGQNKGRRKKPTGNMLSDLCDNPGKINNAPTPTRWSKHGESGDAADGHFSQGFNSADLDVARSAGGAADLELAAV